MNTSSQSGLAGLFGGAQSQGVISAGALGAININDIGANIQDALGVSVDDIEASEVTLVSQLVDDSGSIRFAGNEPVVRDGHNLVLKSLTDSKQKDEILAMCRYLNGQTLYPYDLVSKAVQMDSKNYQGRGGTPLYDETVTTLAAVIAKTQEFNNNGCGCRSVTLIVSDGADAGSRRCSPADVKKIVDDMMRQECHIVAFMGIWDGDVDPVTQAMIPGTGTDFRKIAKSMGIRDEWVLTPGNTESEIRAAFQMFSQSAVRASQGAGAFSTAAMGGFGNP
jgi:hypothetical protein